MNNVLTVEQIFSERILRVPDYQRGYAWEDVHLQEFIDDLELLAPEKEHYTGTVVLHAQPSAERVQDETGQSYGRFDVVDGQQRLTTIVLLLDAIRREFAERPATTKLAEGIERGYIAVRDRSGATVHKLQLNGDVHRYFVDNALADTPSLTEATIASHQRLRAARTFFREHLERQREAMAASFEDWLLGLRNKIARQLKLSLYTAHRAREGQELPAVPLDEARRQRRGARGDREPALGGRVQEPDDGRTRRGRGPAAPRSLAHGV